MLLLDMVDFCGVDGIDRYTLVLEEGFEVALIGLDRSSRDLLFTQRLFECCECDWL